jgi:hypothetical protein
MSHHDAVARHEAPVGATDAAVTDRRQVLRTLVAGAAGAAGAAALASRTHAATGDELVLGNLNEADARTIVRTTEAFPDINGPGPIVLQLESPGGHLRFVGAPGDTNFGTYPDGTLVYNGTTGLDIWLNDGLTGTRPTLLARPGSSDAFALLPVPERVYDSRPGSEPNLPNDGRISTGEVRTIDLLASGTEQIAENISGVMVNLTVTETIGFGFLTVFSDAVTTTPLASSINWFANGMTVANNVVSATRFARLKVACGGGGSTHFIVDVVGTYG